MTTWRRTRPGTAPGSVADSAVVREFWGEHTTRFTRLAHRSPAFVDILTDPFYLGVADEVLLPNGNGLLDEHRAR